MVGDVMETAQLYELALRRIADLHSVYLEQWDATVEAGLDDAKAIARDALRRARGGNDEEVQDA